MKKIQMVDLQSQYQEIKGEIDAAIQGVIDSAEFVKGKRVAEFEQHLAEYLGVKHVIPVGNGTDALQIALMGMGLEKGDEVIIPTFTFVAAAEVVALLGYKPVLVDVDEDTFNISIEAMERAISARTRVIIPVHLFGQNAEMEAIMKVAKAHGVRVLEDACQSIGARYYFGDGTVGRSGCMGDVGCTSFFPSKNLGCYGDGGAIFTNDDELAERMRMVANHGMRVRYYHDAVGVNSRLDTIQAAVLDVKLGHLDRYIAERQRSAAFYDRAFEGNEGLVRPVKMGWTEHIYHQYTLRVKGGKRDALRAYLAEKGVPAMVYYPKPLHVQEAYRGYGKVVCPVAERLCGEVLSLPMHTELTEEQLGWIADAVNGFTK